MELRDWAIRILSGDTLEEKLLAPEVLTDFQPGPPLIWQEPTRPVGMQFKKHTAREKLPKFHQHGNPDKRAVCLHRFAGHELLAVEIMAYALLAFPDAPKHFRKGVANTLKEEQGHVQLYIKRLAEMGVAFGDLPLYRHFWNYVPFLKSPIHYLSVMSLTFEMANLDFAPLYGASFLQHGDEASAALMRTILEDEISHVSFGYRWLQKLKRPDVSEWQEWRESVPERLTPDRACGFTLFEENRKRAGIPDEWIEFLKKGLKA
ncbi:MAG: DUF455 family protein [Chlamydiales bacterium]|nr:DUF455 family protein [Chlamydiales bacterium]